MQQRLRLPDASHIMVSSSQLMVDLYGAVSKEGFYKNLSSSAGWLLARQKRRYTTPATKATSSSFAIPADGIAAGSV